VLEGGLEQVADVVEALADALVGDREDPFLGAVEDLVRVLAVGVGVFSFDVRFSGLACGTGPVTEGSS